jgi:hypothetical protein
MNPSGRRNSYDLDALGASHGAYISRRGFVIDEWLFGISGVMIHYLGSTT